MTDGTFSSRWPFETGAQSLSESSHRSETGSATAALVQAAAEAVNAEPRALPTLNDRVDPDYLESIRSGSPRPSPGGVRIAVQVSFGEMSVLLCDDGRVSVHPEKREPNRSERAITVDHEWYSTGSPLVSIGRAVAARSGKRPTDITKRLGKTLDVDAVNRLLRPRADGTERIDSRLLLSIDGYEVAMESAGSIVVEPSLSVLKRSGAALLVVGSVPEEAFDQLSSTLFGEGDTARSSVFALHGRDIETAKRRLSMGGLTPSQATVIRHYASARAASASSTEEPEPEVRELEVISTTGESRSLFEAVRNFIADTEFAAPGELRLSVDSLQSVITSTDLETTVESIRPLCRTLRENRGIGHFLFPIDADSDKVEALAPAFDAIVEVRMGTSGLEQRWQLTGTDHATPWFALE